MISTRTQPDEHADRGQRVGAQVGGVALERRRVERRARGGRGRPRRTRLATAEKPITAMPTPRSLDLRADDQPAGRLEDDDPGADQDQHALDRRGQVLDLLVAVGVLAVGGLVGLADRDEGDHRGEQVDRRVDRLGDDRDRAGDRAGGELERDQERVRGDREPGGARLGAGSRAVSRPDAERRRRAPARRGRGG